MCPSSWKLYLDDFPFLGSSLAHLEPKLELFEFWEFRSWWLFVARLYPIYVLFAFKIFLLPVPTRPGTRPFFQVPDPSRPEVKNPYPSDPAGSLWWRRVGWLTTTCRQPWGHSAANMTQIREESALLGHTSTTPGAITQGGDLRGAQKGGTWWQDWRK